MLADSRQVVKDHRHVRFGVGLLYVYIGYGVCTAGVSTEGTRGTDSRLLSSYQGTMLAGSLSCVACLLIR